MADAAFLDVSEPAGARRLAAPVAVGGLGARLVVPGTEPGEQLRFEHVDSGWSAAVIATSRVRLNGELLGPGPRDLRAGDTLSIGDAQLTIRAAQDGAMHLLVRHLAGNDTVAPLRPPPTRAESDDEDDIDIVAGDAVSGLSAARGAAREAIGGGAEPRTRPRRYVWVAAAALAALLLVFGVLSRLQRVPLDVLPREAQVSVAGLVSWQSGSTLFALPGKHQLRAELAGYATLERALEVRETPNATQVLRLAKLPGLVTVDTQGVPAEVAVDGQLLGKAPGVLKVPAGARTFTVRAERYLDAVARLEVEGRGVAQTLQVALQTAWGKLDVSATSPGAVVSVDGAAAVALPATVDLPGGLHRVRISAPDTKAWESAVIVVAGKTLRLGPIALGAPDAQVALRSTPAGADVTVSGIFKGRTPLTVMLPAGATYDIAVTRAGYTSWSRSVAAEPGARQNLQAVLAPILVALSVAGEPADAELLVDGTVQGKLPRNLQLTATSHDIEVRKPGLQPFTTRVDLSAGVARSLEYRLIPEGRAADWRPPAERIASKQAGAFVLVAPTSYLMGSARREQGRRPNETQRRVTFSRAFYIGVREVTNGEFRRFRAEHRSGFVGKQSLDLDNQAVSSVSFDDAAAYCNWLSKQEGLPEAYESKNGRMVLKQPVNTGYRLPTEAEWEYAARHTPQGLRRYEWGNSLPWPSGVANLAGAETGNAPGELLADFRDDYPVVAPVGRFAANALGLHDLTGNVSEWVNDRYASFQSAAAVIDPLGPDTGRAAVVRGASWRTATVAGLRLAARESAEAARDDLGFRLARYAE